MIRSTFLWLAVVVLALACTAEARSLRVGEPVRQFQLADLGGKKVDAVAPGKAVVLYFWTDACGCRDQLIELKQYVASLGNRPFSFVTVNAGQEKEKVERFVSENKIAYRVLLDDKARVARDQFGIKVLPTVFVIDKSGNLREKLIGVVDTKKLQIIINKYL